METLIPLSVNEDSAVVFFLISDIVWLRACGESIGERSKNNFRESWPMIKLWTESAQPVEMKTANGHGHHLSLLKSLVQKRAENQTGYQEKVCFFVDGYGKILQP